MKSIKEIRNELSESKKNKTLGKGGPGYSTVSPSMVKDIISRYKKGKLDKIPIALVRFIEFANLSMSRLKPIEQDRIDSLVTAGIVDRKQGRYVLSKDVKKIIGESKQEDLIEAKLSPDQRKRLDGLIGDVIDVTDPFYLGLGIPGNNVDLEKTLETIESEFGKEVRDSVENGIDIWHYGRENRADGDDPLDNIFHRRGKGRITKKGKLNKQDAESLKKSIKKNLKSSSLRKSRFAESKQSYGKGVTPEFKKEIEAQLKKFKVKSLDDLDDKGVEKFWDDFYKQAKAKGDKMRNIADLKALLKNPDPKVAKNYGGISGYKKMIQSKIDKLLSEGKIADRERRLAAWRTGYQDAKNGVEKNPYRKSNNSASEYQHYIRGQKQADLDDNLKEETELNEEQWVVYNKDTKKTKFLKTWKGAKKYADKNGGKVYDGAYFQDHKDEILKEEAELDEAMSRAARIKRSKVMKRLQPKIKRAKERAAKKKASSDVIDKRAEKQAKEVLIKKWLKGKSKGDVPFAERERIGGKLKKSKKAIDRIKKKLVKDIRKQEAGKLAKKESTELGENKRNIPDDYIDFMDDDKSWIAVKAKNSGEDTVRGEIAKKNWPTGAPVTRTFAKGTAQIPDGEFWVIVAKKYWYWKQDNGKWAALPRKGATPPFDY